MIHDVKPAAGAVVSCGPAFGICADGEVERPRFGSIGLRIMDDHDDVHVTIGQGAAVQGHETEQQLLIPAGRNDYDKAELRRWFSRQRLEK